MVQTIGRVDSLTFNKYKQGAVCVCKNCGRTIPYNSMVCPYCKYDIKFDKKN